MRNPSLTRWSHKLPDGRLVSAYEFEGESIWVCDSAKDALFAIDLFKRDDLDPLAKSELIFKSIFPCIQCLGRDAEYLSSLLIHIIWEAFGLDATETKEHSAECDAPVFDFEEDAARIKAVLLSYYGFDWNTDAQNLTYSDLCALLAQVSEADHETVPGCLPNFKTSFAQAVYFRTVKPPKPDKHNKELRKAFLDMKKSLALENKHEKKNRAEAANDAMAALFASAKRGA